MDVEEKTIIVREVWWRDTIEGTPRVNVNMGMVEANAQKQVQMAIQDTGTFELLLAKAQQTYSVLSEYRHRPKKTSFKSR